MTLAANKRFAVYPTEGGRCAARPVVNAADFFHAALIYAESAPCEGQLSVTVVDKDSGEERCFHLDLDADSAVSC